MPDLFRKNGEELLKDGRIKIKSEWHTWSSICERAPLCFEVLLTGTQPKNFSNAVFNKLYTLVPHSYNPKPLSQLTEFLKQIDQVAPPVIQFG